MKKYILLILSVFFLIGCNQGPNCNNKLYLEHNKSISVCELDNIFQDVNIEDGFIKENKYEYNTYLNIEKFTRFIALQLVKSKNRVALYKESVLLSSLVNINNMEETLDWSEVLMDNLSINLYKLGIGVKEYRKRGSIVVKNNRQYFLTKDFNKIEIDELVNKYVLVATYSEVSANKYLINVKIIDNRNGEVLSVASGFLYKKNKRKNITRKIKIVSR